MKNINDVCKIEVKKVNDHALKVTYNSPTMEDIFKGMSAGDNDLFKNRTGYGGHAVEHYLIKNTDEAESYLRDQWIAHDVNPSNHGNYDSLLIDLAGEWNTLRNIYKETFGEPLRSKAELEEMAVEKKRGLLDGILTSQGRNLSDNTTPATPLQLGRGYNTSEKYVSEDIFMESLKTMTENPIDEDTSEYYSPIDEEEIFPIIFTGRARGVTIIVNKADDGYLLTETRGESFTNTKYDNLPNLIKGITEEISSFGYVKLEENKDAINFSFSEAIKTEAIKTTTFLSAKMDFSSTAAIKRIAKEYEITGRTGMNEDELIEAIANACLEKEPVKKIANGPACFLRHKTSHNYGGSQKLITEITEDDSLSALITAYISSVEGRGEGSSLRLLHDNIISLPSSRLPKNKPGYYGSDQGLEIIEFPDVFSE